MEPTRSEHRWAGPPLALQIMGLLLGGLVVAQLVTLALTLLIPPEPQPQYDLNDIARALSGVATDGRNARSLQRVLQATAPDLRGPGWLTSDRSRRELATLLRRDEADVQLYFFTPLPFAGTARPVEKAEGSAPSWRAQYEMPTPDDPVAPGLVRVDFLVAQRGPGGPTMPALSSPTFSRPAEPLPSPAPSPSPPPTPAPDAGAGPAMPDGTAGSATPSTGPDSNGRTNPSAGEQRPDSATMAAPSNPRSADAPAPAGAVGLDGRPLSNGSGHPTRADASPAGATDPGHASATPEPRSSSDARAATVATPSSAGSAADSESRQDAQAHPPIGRNPVSTAASAPALATESLPAPPAILNATTTPERPSPLSHPIAVPAAARGLFGFGTAPFIEGDFVAAMRVAEGWAVVQPRPEPFPNAWQRRVLLWFLVAAAVVAPIGWWFSRRLVRPIAGFAAAAERLGRDPTAPILALEGPAEVGRAAHAFNRMQSRLRSFVDDRTAMIGAISHDLRTPLTRMRFRIEDIPDEQREGMLQEVGEMEQMISSVLSFIRDASEPGSREVLDLSSIVEDVVDDAVFVGQDVRLDNRETAPVEVDAIGMRRLLGNLVENAVKYGGQARVRLFTDRQDAVTEISDPGPGLSDTELEQVFQPFYRAPGARASGKQGSGLGLAVCRSIARAHGGDVQLTRGAKGLVARVRLPLAYQESKI
jgi:two-component system OmpR family sensor kinase